jgi:dinuclear metal center YbgI/SA1388 family protein
MAELKKICSYLDQLLDISGIPGDHSNNGLQVEACGEVKKAVFAVDASRELFEKAAKVNADFIFVHHGISWGSEPRRITGTTARRLSILFNNGIALYAAHLPLDAHPEIGHNALLADRLGLKERRMFSEYNGSPIGCCGQLPEPRSLEAIADSFEDYLDCKSEIFGSIEREVRNIGIISGGGGLDGLLASAAEGMDCFITGEFNHTMYHHVKELGIPVITLGHYCSEKPGILAVMELLNEQFGIDCEFIDIPTGL